MVREDDHRFVLTTFDACYDNICMGTTDGKIYLHSISKGLYLYKRFEIARGGDGQIVNCLKFLNRELLLTATNDCTVKIWDLEQMKPKLNFDFKDPINVAAISPDGNLLGVYGDCLQAEILDLRSGEVITTLHGHTDFGFSLCWHPNGKILATGNQDLTCKIWDVRYLNQNSSAYCIKTLECAIGASADVKFAGRGGS